MNAIRLNLPLSDNDVRKLRSGQIVYLSGTVLTGRDAAHKRMVETVERGDKLPFEINKQCIYYVGPCPAPYDHVIGAAGPTTSKRMDPFTTTLLSMGLKGMIGKGPRAGYIQEALREYEAVYFLACGGAGALLAQHISEVEIVAYEDLGTEAVRKLTITDFPAVVANDIYGGSIFR